MAAMTLLARPMPNSSSTFRLTSLHLGAMPLSASICGRVCVTVSPLASISWRTATICAGSDPSLVDCPPAMIPATCVPWP